LIDESLLIGDSTIDDSAPRPGDKSRIINRQSQTIQQSQIIRITN